MMLFAPGAALAQRPICAPLSSDERVHTVCEPFSLYPAIRFLADFSVDQLFKPSPPAFVRSIVDTSIPFAGNVITEDVALRAFLSALPPVRFSQLDRTTGTVIGDFDMQALEFHGPIANETFGPKLSIRLPRHLEGGYWRAPDVLQIAFWEDQRISIRLGSESKATFEGAVACLSLSPDGLLIRFAPESTSPVLILFRECPT